MSGAGLHYVAKSCLFCGGQSCSEEICARTFTDADLNSEVFSARRVTEHFHYAFLRCRATGLIYAREALSAAALRTLYAASRVNFAQYAGVLRQDYWAPLAGRIGPRGGSALEIGCSSGFFLEELLARGFREVCGCEPSLEAKQLAPETVKGFIHTRFFEDLPLADETFDLICCFQTVDHLHDPLRVLELCLKKLRRGGLLYLIVHDTDALQFRLWGAASPIIDVEHIYLFNSRTLSLLLDKAGFSGIETFGLRNSYPLEYLLRHAPVPGRRLLLKLAASLGVDARRVALPLGNLGVFAYKS